MYTSRMDSKDPLLKDYFLCPSWTPDVICGTDIQSKMTHIHKIKQIKLSRSASWEGQALKRPQNPHSERRLVI